MARFEWITRPHRPACECLTFSCQEAGELEGATEPAPVQASHRLENGDGRVDGRQRSSSRGKLNHDPGVRQGDRGNRHDRGSYGPSHRGSSDSSRDRATAVQLTEQLKELLKRTRIAEANRSSFFFAIQHHGTHQHTSTQHSRHSDAGMPRPSART